MTTSSLTELVIKTIRHKHQFLNLETDEIIDDRGWPDSYDVFCGVNGHPKDVNGVNFRIFHNTRTCEIARTPIKFDVVNLEKAKKLTFQRDYCDKPFDCTVIIKKKHDSSRPHPGLARRADTARDDEFYKFFLIKENHKNLTCEFKYEKIH